MSWYGYAMSTNQNSSNQNGKRYVLYVPTPFKGPQNKDLLDRITTVAKKLFKGATFSPAGTGIYVEKNKDTGRFEEFVEKVRTLEIITSEESDSKIAQVAYAALCALDEKRPEDDPERTVWYTEQSIVIHKVRNPKLVEAA